MKYATLFRNPSMADGFNINNIPWVGWEMERESSLVCNEEGKKITVDEQGNASVVDAGPELISFTVYYYTGYKEEKPGNDFTPWGVYYQEGE